MQLTDFDFQLPTSLIAQQPLAERSSSRLLCLSGTAGVMQHLSFNQLPELLLPNDLLVFNDTRVIKARLLGRKVTGGKMEIFVERVLDNRHALAMLRSSKKIKIGTEVVLLPNETDEVDDGGGQYRCVPPVAKIIAQRGNFFVVEFALNEYSDLNLRQNLEQLSEKSKCGEYIWEILEQYGRIPLPPYIERTPNSADEERYQSIFAKYAGAVAAPTASLHFDEALLQRIRQLKDIDIAFVTLHVGAGTFQPVRVTEIEQHQMHHEYMEISAETCAKIMATKARGGRVIAVGTTCVRSLETAAMLCCNSDQRSGSVHNHENNYCGDDVCNGARGVDCIIKPWSGETNIFIYPGYQFRCVDALITNFHLPQSTLLMLVCAFAGYDNVMNAYREAVQLQYRFFSYGDAMFITAQ